jgi:hypothetical protein
VEREVWRAGSAKPAEPGVAPPHDLVERADEQIGLVIEHDFL